MSSEPLEALTFEQASDTLDKPQFFLLPGSHYIFEIEPAQQTQSHALARFGCLLLPISCKSAGIPLKRSHVSSP
ncbi:hypothetical protein BG36_07945 [Aquamicrobium defluvii]|uniref:Uncharacterized protein n=1 Tax=Aquamicrobium defluvii TaxID=69279 RepID=A0A011VPH9_9HYPH|nr:hypothetical protein BG36_07945 [Aquamicrobium defluvii]EZQ17052.1 hypothetical protein CF98_37510 [Halopseudomonas bauzanensis]TDR36409.1 hypothetical protein DES43_10574 [Aquamicrobium defluvii]